jgi:hypothetical protein
MTWLGLDGAIGRYDLQTHNISEEQDKPHRSSLASPQDQASQLLQLLRHNHGVRTDRSCLFELLNTASIKQGI